MVRLFKQTKFVLLLVAVSITVYILLNAVVGFQISLSRSGVIFCANQTHMRLFHLNTHTDMSFRDKYKHKTIKNNKLMNMSLTVAESGALKLRVNSFASDSLNFTKLQRKQEENMNIKMPDANERLQNHNITLKHIIYWNKFSSHKNFNFGEGREAFVRHGCRVDACSASEDRELVPEEEVDAILFDIWNHPKHPYFLPNKKKFTNAKRVAFITEPSARMIANIRSYKNTFDYTITYRHDSDAPIPYGVVRPLKKKKVRMLRNATSIATVTAKKTKIAAWFVSNCGTDKSGRTKLAAVLQKFGVKTDIYGKCGTMSCNRKNEDACYKMVEKKYKFYFSFENSLCNHYYTEKFFNILRYNVVPVVYGLGYELSGTPKHAYIDVFDFPNVKSLADYLLYLHNNDTAYNQYFRWKNDYEIITTFTYEHPFCKLCEDLHHGGMKKYQDLYMWNTEGQCIDVKKNKRIKDFLSGNC